MISGGPITEVIDEANNRATISNSLRTATVQAFADGSVTLEYFDKDDAGNLRSFGVKEYKFGKQGGERIEMAYRRAFKFVRDFIL